MNSVGSGGYNYTIPGGQVTGNISYYIKAYDTTGREFNTTLYNVPVANFALQPEVSTLTIYRTLSATYQLHLQSINNFTAQVQLSTTGSPNGLTVGFSANPATPGTTAILDISANATIPVGTYPVTLIATYTNAIFPCSQAKRHQRDCNRLSTVCRANGLYWVRGLYGRIYCHPQPL
jgi:hypothetical protein